MARHIYRFGDYHIDLSARELHCSSELSTLSPKVFDCLAYLIEHRDRAVGRDELIAAVWGKVDVTDTLLGQTVLKARRAIGDTGNEQNAIRTIPRFGYRWIAEVIAEEPPAVATGAPLVPSPAVVIEATEAASSPVADAPSPTVKAVAPPLAEARPWRRGVRVGTAAAVAAITAILLVGLSRLLADHAAGSAHPASTKTAPAAAAAIDAAAVLPVEVSSQGEWSWLRLGLMDLIALRMRSAGLAVVPSDNVVALARGGGDVATVAKTVAESTGARIVVLPSASRTAGGWIVRLTLRAADGRERDVEARHDDVIEAGRAAADRLLALLGKHATGDEAPDLSTGALLSRAEAALLTDDLVGARGLLEGAPAAAQQSPELRLRLAQIDFRAGQFDSAGRRLDTLLTEVGAETNPVLRARCLIGRGVVYIRTEQAAAATPAFTQAIALLEDRNQPAALGQAYTGRAVSYAAQGGYDAALADFSRARIALELAGDALALARVEENEGIVSAKRGRFPEALAAHQRSAQRFERFGALNELADTWANEASAQLVLLQPADALATTERAWPLVGRLENRRTRHMLQIERAAALAENGRLTEAHALLDNLAAEATQDADPLLLARVHFEQAALDFEAGHFDSAAALAATATAALDNEDYQRERASAWLLLTRALRAQGKDAVAAAEVGRLQAWAKERPTAPMPVYAALAGAERDWTERKRDASRAAYDEALALAEKVDVPADTAQVVVSYGTSLIADGELEHASAVAGLAARWSERDFASALLQVRYYRALGERDAWRVALQRAQGLAGERAIPPILAQAPASGSVPATASVP